jgi:hypothetical protein
VFCKAGYPAGAQGVGSCLRDDGYGFDPPGMTPGVLIITFSQSSDNLTPDMIH